MKENWKRIPLLVILCYFLLFCLFHTEEVVSYILSYTNLFIQKVFPTSFIFFIISSLLIEYQFLQTIHHFTKRGSIYFYFFLMTVFSGFPSGALYAKEFLQKKVIDSKIGNQFLLYSHFPNPLFVFYTVSLAFQNQQFIFPLYGIILLSNFFIYCFLSKQKKSIVLTIEPFQDFSFVLSRIILKTTKNILVIYGTSIFFYLLSLFICPYFSTIPALYVFLNGFFDLTNGVISTALLKSDFIKGVFLFFFLSFGSLSIHMQVKSILADTRLSYYAFVKGRIISFFICVFLWIIYFGCTIFI